MLITTKTEPYCSSYYISDQPVLPLETAVKIDINDPVISFAMAMKGVDFSKYYTNKTHRGNQGYNKKSMMLIVLFAHMIKVHKLREIEDRCKYDLRFMWLSEEICPSHATIGNFINSLTESIEKIFADISLNVANLMRTDLTHSYIDGTKIEANANKYSFVYKKRIITSMNRLFPRITEQIILLNQAYGYCFPVKYFYDSLDVGYIAQYLMEIMVSLNIEPIYGKGTRKTQIQRFYDDFMDYYIKLNEYEYWLSIIGARNSCSKVDHDATMMSLKEDFYTQSGVTKPAYNVQAAVSDGLVMNVEVFQNPSDSKTFIPFMEKFYKMYGFYPKFPVADAGYGSYDNYFYCLEKGMELFMKYTMYSKKNTTEFKKKKYNSMNWETNEDGYKVCPNGGVFNMQGYDSYDDSGRYLRIIHHYKCEKKCRECPLYNECCPRGNQRIVTRNVVLEEFESKVDENLRDEHGKECKKQRCIQAEGVFGILKRNFGYERLERKGIKKVKLEILLMFLGINLSRYHNWRIQQSKH